MKQEQNHLSTQHPQAGFTLVELLVYIALASIVILMAGTVFVDSIRFRANTTRKMQTYSGTAQVVQDVEVDWQQVGVKGQKLMNELGVLDSGVYWDTTNSDYSSFELTAGLSANLDILKYRTGVFNDSGRIIGVELIQWHVDGQRNLWRKHERVGVGNADSVIMMRNVSFFNIEAGIYTGDSGATVQDFSYGSRLSLYPVQTAPLVVADSGQGVSISGFAPNTMGEVYLDTGGIPLPITLKSGVTYAFETTLSVSEAILSGYDAQANLMAFDLRKISNGLNVSDRLDGTDQAIFYPGADYVPRPRYFEFSHHQGTDVQVCPVFRFMFNPTHTTSEARVYVTRIRVWEANEAHYEWKSGFSSAQVAQKARVKALRLTLSVESDGEVTRVQRVIPIPNNGV